MARAVQAFLPFLPPHVTHNDLEAYTYKRGGRTIAGIRKSDRLKGAEDMMRPYVERLARADACPMTGALRMTVKVCFPRGDHEQGEPHTVPPDLDNFIKTFQDLCQRCHVIDNDSRVAELRACKVWADPPGVFVRFEEIPHG